MRGKTARFEAITILIVVLITGTACGTRNTESGNKTQNEVTNSPFIEAEEPLATQQEETKKCIVWLEDVTQDGYKDRIEMELTYINEEHQTGEEQTVKVYSGKTGKDIWFTHAGTTHCESNSMYVYKEPSDGKAYLLTWEPYMCCGDGSFWYKIFSLDDETGREDVFKSDRYEFSVERAKKEEIEKLDSFVKKANKLLKESYVVVDTTEGNFCYSEQDKPTTKLYDPSSLEESMKETMEGRYKGD